MSQFWKIRIGMSIWGFLVAWFFTDKIDLTSKIFISQLAGNSLILWVFLNKNENKKTVDKQSELPDK